MSITRKIRQRTQRRALRSRSSLAMTLPRVSVFRSARHIYAQVIDPVLQRTLMSCSSLELNKIAGDKKAIARAVGLELAQRARAQGITKAAFDRGPFLYHGRVQSLAEGLREGGLTI